jgi:glycosyltransferase involved in cell wall biosynthesis
MNYNPLVSVIIPCYNVTEYVDKAVYSILGQTYTNLEIIIIDDASTDDTLLKIKAIKDARIKLIEFKENTKKIEAVNASLKLATGELIAFQDADDWSEPNRIEQQLKWFQSIEDLGICFTKYRLYSHTITVPVKIAQSDAELKDEFLKFGLKELTDLAPTMCATMMITRAVLEKTTGYHPYFAGRVAEDIHWVYRILKEFKGVAIDEPLYNITIREGSLTQMQYAGCNVKAAYAWHLLSHIVDKDIQENIDILDPVNNRLLQDLELKACEHALEESILRLNSLKFTFENSMSYKLGKLFLTPVHLLKSFKKTIDRRVSR